MDWFKITSRIANTTLSAHVYCADTNAPAQMGSVILQPISNRCFAPQVMTNRSRLTVK